jgi:hypothetical protein
MERESSVPFCFRLPLRCVLRGAASGGGFERRDDSSPSLS